MLDASPRHPEGGEDGDLRHIDQEWREIEAFLRLYYQTMRRVGADQSYYFPRDYFSDLRRALDGRLHLCVVEFGGQIISAGLFAETSDIVQYYLSGSDEEFLAYSPLKTMLDFVRRWAKGRGNRVLHLGGGLSSLFAFKAGFSRARHPFYTWRAVTDEPAYRALIERWELCSGMRADGIDGFFPAYRRGDPRVRGSAPDRPVRPSRPSTCREGRGRPGLLLAHNYFSDLRRALDGHLHLCVVEFGGRIISVGLFAETSGIVQHCWRTASWHAASSTTDTVA